jgi:phosphotriesterase-related protein
MRKENGTIYTVRGPIAGSELGFTLPHEHIMVDFGGAAAAGKHRYEAGSVVKVMQPYLQDLFDQGVQTLHA